MSSLMVRMSVAGGRLRLTAGHPATNDGEDTGYRRCAGGIDNCGDCDDCDQGNDGLHFLSPLVGCPPRLPFCLGHRPVYE